jgi:hypothetical protein
MRTKMRTNERARSERGVALVVALLAMLMMVALGAGLMVAAATESKITRNFRNSTEAFYAAEAAVEGVLGELRAVDDWNLILSGATRSAFVDGEPWGTRTLADGTTLDLARIVNDVNCRKADACFDAAMDAVTAERPWGANNPRWQLFAWGYLKNLTSGATIESPFYVVVMVADDPSECDDNPLVDGGPPVSCPVGTTRNPGAGVLAVRAEAFGPFGSHRAIELSLTNKQDIPENAEVMPTETAADTTGYSSGSSHASVRILTWREVR